MTCVAWHSRTLRRLKDHPPGAYFADVAGEVSQEVNLSGGDIQRARRDLTADQIEMLVTDTEARWLPVARGR